MGDITPEDRKKARLEEASEVLGPISANLQRLDKSIRAFNTSSTMLSIAMIFLALVTIVLMIMTNWGQIESLLK